MKKLLVLLFCLVAVSVYGQRNRSFDWSLALQDVKSGEMVPFSTTVPAQTGEQYRLVVQPSARCFCYVVTESANGDVGVLYSGVLRQAESWYSPAMILQQPGGMESLFIIVSGQEQKTLAQRVAAYKKNSGSSQKRALMNEVFRVRSDTSAFRENPEKPVLMGGASRGEPDKNQGLEYSGQEIYLKTISIEH